MIGPVSATNPDEQDLVSRTSLRFIGEQPVEANARIAVDAKSQRVLALRVSYRYKVYPSSAGEVHTNVRINEAVPSELFAFEPTPGAIQVDDLGERTDEYEYLPRR